MKNNAIKNDYVELWEEDGIIFQCFRPGLKEITLEMAKKIVEDRLPLFGGKMKPLFVIGNDIGYMYKETREYFTSPESIRYINASTFFIENPITYIAGKFFLIFNKPTVRTEIFSDKDKALNWLKQYRQ